MGLDVAIDELYASGWSSRDLSGCQADDDGRWYPTVERIMGEVASLGFELSLRHIQLFDCYRAEWAEAQGKPCGAVVGQTEAEAAVYALSQMRRMSATLPTPTA